MAKLLPPRNEKPKKEPLKTSISFRCPNDLVRWMDEIGGARGYERSEIMIDALSHFRDAIEEQDARASKRDSDKK